MLAILWKQPFQRSYLQYLQGLSINILVIQSQDSYYYIYVYSSINVHLSNFWCRRAKKVLNIVGIPCTAFDQSNQSGSSIVSNE